MRQIVVTLVLTVCTLTTQLGRTADKLIIQGVEKDIEASVLAYLSLDDLPCTAPRWWVDRAYKQARVDVRSALEAYGYYQPVISPGLEWRGDCWRATFSIEPGEPVQINEAHVSTTTPLANEGDMQTFLADSKLAGGRRFTHDRYESHKDQMLNIAESLGYFDASFQEHHVSIAPAQNTADISIRLDGGERYRLGDVRVHQDALHPQLFDRYLTLQPGNPYSSKAMNETYARLLESGYYDRVNLSPDLDSRSGGVVDVDVHATAGSKRTTVVGVGYATDTGPRVRGDLRYRRVNDRGHRANLGLLASPVTSEVSIEYRLPYGDPTHQWLAFTASLKHEDTDTSRSTTRSVGASRTQRRGAHWTETNYVDVRNEDFDVAEQEGQSNLVLLGSSWTRTTAIDAPRPMHGHTLSFDVRGASDALLSDTSFIQVITKAKQIVPLGSKIRLLGRVTAGWTLKEALSDLPPSIRFFAGGDNSVRGYGYEELGPEVDDEVIGGSKLLTGSLELDVPVRTNWSLAAFVDSGSAFDSSPSFSTGVGIGIRWFSPLGPLRLDIAHPLDDPDNNVRIHISLGTDL